MQSGYIKFTHDPETGCVMVEAFIESDVDDDSPVVAIINDVYEYIQVDLTEEKTLN